MSSRKHAFLILAHTSPGQINILTELLATAQCDVYLHMDAKRDFLLNELEARSNLEVFSKHVVDWGEYGLILATLELLHRAITREDYAYLHLLSGQCLPLLPVDALMQRFVDGFPRQYMDCAPFPVAGIPYRGFDRILVSYPPGLRGRFRGAKAKEQEAYKLAVLGDPARHRPLVGMPPLYHGSQWFSITARFATWILEYTHKRPQFGRFFESSLIPDEMFFQTILMDSPFAQDFTRETSRYMDWKQGGPHTFREADLPALLACGRCFARKFDVRHDPHVVMRVRQRVLDP